jgi:preprotein translocase subunit SecE
MSGTNFMSGIWRRFGRRVSGCIQIPAAGITRRFGLRGFEKERQLASKTTNPFTFLQQVRSETAKVTWPSRRETMISTVMVLAFAFIAAIFFFTADQLMAYGVELILGIGR